MKPTNLHLKSVLEAVSQPVFNAKTLDEGKRIITDYIEQKKINGEDKVTILKNVNECRTLVKLQTYLCNSLLTYEGMGTAQLNKSARKAAVEDSKLSDN